MDGREQDREQGREEIRRAVRAVLAVPDTIENQLDAIEKLVGQGAGDHKPELLDVLKVCLFGLVRASEDNPVGRDRFRYALWCIAGEALFVDGKLPSRQDLLDTATVVLVAALFRDVSTISEAARRLGVSRRLLRAFMRRVRIYETWKQGGLRNFGRRIAERKVLALPQSLGDPAVPADTAEHQDPPPPQE